ncbi:MAG: sulfatase-like hydrolase/transferase [Candidatus Lokiarchaeota archaeon]|nr:sulfatase-like hydrolase/transferase [Candidatus Lokiarchaeota archaeon]
MNIFWILTDSICNYERSDLHGLLPIYNKLKKENEGFYFEDCISQFPSTNLSLFSFLTGRFPYYIFPDYYRSIENLPSLKYKNFIEPLKEENYRVQSIIFGREQAVILKDILNPFYETDMYKGDHWLDAKEVYQYFIQKVEKFQPDEKNFLFTFFRPSGPQTDKYLRKIIEYLKEQDYWENSIIIINSDHGFYDKNLYKKTKLLHFDDIHQSSMQPVLFIKLPTSLTSSHPRIIEKRTYLVDLMETILDYLNINISHERDSISFKELIEKDIDVNNQRTIRGDCYLMFQAVKRTMIIKSNWKLVNNNGIFSLYNLSEDHLERKDVKNEHHEIFDELYQFYLMTELKAYKTFESLLYSLYEQSILPKLKSSKIFIPRQFPPQLVRFLKENLAKNNTIINTQDLNDLQLNDDQKLTTILFYNRLTGIRLKKLIRKYKEQTKRFIILDTELNEVSSQLNQTGYLKFVLRSIWARRKLLFQRWKEIIVWILYFPLYFNKYARKYYK